MSFGELVLHLRAYSRSPGAPNGRVFFRPARQKIAGILAVLQDFLTQQDGKIPVQAACREILNRLLDVQRVRELFLMQNLILKSSLGETCEEGIQPLLLNFQYNHLRFSSENICFLENFSKTIAKSSRRTTLKHHQCKHSTIIMGF
jgi:hypothetical protein